MSAVDGKPSAVVFAQEGDQYLGTPYSEIDCQELAERMLRGVGIRKNLRGSNAWFREMTWTGTPEECLAVFGEIPVGAFLYIWEPDGAPGNYGDGLGNASHMGVYIGRMGGAIHASKSRGCVCYSDFKGKSIRGGWNRVGLWIELDWGERINGMLRKEQGMGSERKCRVTAPAGKNVNLRNKASEAGALVDRIPLGETVIASEVGDGTWSAVRWGNKTGYMMTRFLEVVDEAPKTAAPATPTDLKIEKDENGWDQVKMNLAQTLPTENPRWQQEAPKEQLQIQVDLLEERVRLLEAAVFGVG